VADRRHAALLLLAIGCGGPAESKLPRSNLLRYSASGMTGGVTFVVRQNGTVAYESTLSGQTRRVDAKVTQPELDKLSADLHGNDCCSLESKQKQGKPDEPRPSYSVRMGDLDCEVALWGTEIGELPEAQACLRALHDFGEAMAKKATLPE
jgi:hypothetical protein